MENFSCKHAINNFLGGFAGILQPPPPTLAHVGPTYHSGIVHRHSCSATSLEAGTGGKLRNKYHTCTRRGARIQRDKYFAAQMTERRGLVPQIPEKDVGNKHFKYTMKGS